MVDLTKSPFHLKQEQLDWVERTIGSMTLEEKIGQLFIFLNWDRRPGKAQQICEKYHVGGLRWQGGTLGEVYEQNREFQQYSKVPVLIAANCEAGGNGAVKEGTLVAPPSACAASPTTDTAYEMGRVGGAEAAAIGCNWTFAPVSDVLFNWRNTIVNTRAFGDDPDTIIACATAYMRGMAQSNIACCTKHFPGDGSEERDQHLVMGCNDLSVADWDASYGRVYKALFEAGLESVMVGHICLPAYSKALRPSMRDEDILPATLSPELLQDLLREKLGFNGLILTDASHMAGLACAAPRREQVPGAIAAGCDMFLFFNDPDEDFGYMLDGYRNGIITETRLSDALHRILGLKAKLGLDRLAFPQKSGLAAVGCEAHHKAAQTAADETITLVKDTQRLLPVDPAAKKRVALYFVESAPVSYLDGTDPVKKIVIEELERVGFAVTAHRDYYEMEAEHADPMNRMRIIEAEPVEEFKKKYDLVLMVVNMKGYAQENNVRIKWSASHSSELPWFVHEVPTVGMSLNYTNHLIDLPMLKTFINAYAPTREYIRAAVEKITGRSPFRGKANDIVWCGRWDTRL
ncbi:MAG: glycoside hydrolase family 3 N-terminal domain-containing protein [Oscillospiraceae bacterium]|nr:glycoside hydrolase family 3 N-terminal domain-containing protein [Oscillospiraceae bacterium]